MLEFFRKYQKYFFVLITAVIIASFSFFGTLSTVSQEEKKSDICVAIALDGKPMMRSEVQAVVRFLSSDREDSGHSGSLPNLCNDGVIRYDFLKTGLADMLANAYFDAMKGECASRLDRAKRFKPYSHPEAPFVSVEMIWRRFAPGILQELTDLKEQIEVSPDTFSKLSRLYQQQSQMNPEMLKRILLYQNQNLGLKIDPILQYSDLSLFGFHSLSDWFGKNFLVLASEFILNAAAMAEQKGCAVSLEEAKGDLLLRFQESIGKLKSDRSQEEISYPQHLHALGFDEKGAAEVWRKVLLFRKYFQGVSQAAFMDRLPYKDFALYAQETAQISHYSWPKALCLKSGEDLAAFEFYLKAVSPPRKHPMDLPRSFFSVEKVEAEYPELVQSSFKAKVREISLGEVSLRIPLKEVWEWQLDEKNWDRLRREFSTLPQAATREERFKNLEKLDPKTRSLVDRYSRLKVLDLHPERIEEAIASAPLKEETFSLSKESISLPSIDKPWQLYALLQDALSGNEEAKKVLLSYSDNEEILYRFEEVEHVKAPFILTLEEAKEQGIIGRIVDRSLASLYPKLRVKTAEKFQKKEGGWKPLSEVKGELVKAVFPELFEEIEKGREEHGQNDLSEAAYRLYFATEAAKKDLETNPQSSTWLVEEGGNPLENQFKLHRKELNIQRTDPFGSMKEKAFGMMPNEWSPIQISQNGELSFFCLVDKKPCENPVIDQIAFGKETIAADAERYLAEKLLEMISKKHAIVLSEEKAL